MLRALTQAVEGVASVDELLVVLVDTDHWTGRLDEAWELLDGYERARADRFRFATDRTHYVLSHALWRGVLALRLGGVAESMMLDRETGGRPWLPGHPGYATSLSHGGSRAAIAVARCGVLGVDIEPFPPRRPLDDVVAAISTPAERAALAALPPGERRSRATLQLWTHKEALLKAFGTGLACDPARIDTSRPLVVDPDGIVPACAVGVLTLPADLVGSVAIPRALPPARIVVLPA